MDFQPKERVSYNQNWKAYDKAKCSEIFTFMKLLAELCSNIKQPQYKFGRPSVLLSDMIFASALKVYSTFSLRRFMSYWDIALAEGHVETSISYVSISNYMKKSEFMQILDDLIKISSLPLSSVETTFAVDSSGFSTSRFARYFSYKHDKDKRYREWIKAHIICGTKTNIVAAVQLTEGNRNDIHYLKPLVEETVKGFDVKEVLADKAYSSRENHNLIAKLGATPFIPFKKNTTGKSYGSHTWSKMYHYFQYNQEEFLKHYHQRSNCETTFHMIKSKFNDNVRSKDKIAQFNEVMLKILCHNICVLIQETHELGIDAQFTTKQYV